MSDKPRKNSGMTFGRILSMMMVLLVVAQAAMLYIGHYFSGSTNRTIYKQRMELVTQQYAQNVTTQLSGVNNLLSSLSTPDMTNYFQNFMNLRPQKEAAEAETFLTHKFNAMHLSPDVIREIYYFGSNTNQKSHRYDVSEQSFLDIPALRGDTLQGSGVEALLYQGQFQIVRFTADELNKASAASKWHGSLAEQAELSDFVGDIADTPIICSMTNFSNAGQVVIVIVLSTRFFQSTAANVDAGAVYSVTGTNGMVLWSTTARRDLLRAVQSGGSQASLRDGSWQTDRAQVRPFSLGVAYSERRTASPLPTDLLLLSLAILTVSFVFCFFYVRLMLRPFRQISHEIAEQPEYSDSRIVFHPIRFNRRRRFHTMSLRSKIVFLFFAVLSIFIASNSFLYLHLMDRDVNVWLKESSERLGSLAQVGVKDQVQYYENLGNQLSVSNQLQNYLMKNGGNQTANDELEMFSGLSDISYLLLLDSHGTAIYSSLYSYNLDLFSISSTYLRKSDAPYWIVNENNVTGGLPVALLRKIETDETSGVDASYLLIVPKDTAFCVAQTEQIAADFTITDPLGYTICQQGDITKLDWASRHLHYESVLPHTDWTFSVNYVISDVVNMENAYRVQFLAIIAVIFLLALFIAARISNTLTKKIFRVRGEMLTAQTTSSISELEYAGRDEISDIIESYNSMIRRLRTSVRENMCIMEENTRNKIREKELLAFKARAEMHMLQVQINPHFLYNTLNTVSILNTGGTNANISRIVNALSSMLRYSMVITPDTVPLRDEITHAANYITIQQIRFGNNFSARFDIPQELCDLYVPRIVLQPLVENAIQHGFEGWKSGGEIHVKGWLEGRFLCLTVSDNGVGMDPETLGELHREIARPLSVDEEDVESGIGLRNVCQRILLRYGPEGRMTVYSRLMEGTKVTMRFPAQWSRTPPCHGGVPTEVPGGAL